VTSGIRLGSPAATTRGLGVEDFDRVAEAISIVINKQEDGIEEAKAIIKTITDKYPLV
jgi:glycine hydroxymethyltransferase